MDANSLTGAYLEQFPLLLAYVAGLLLALGNLRLGRPAVLFLLGCGILLLTNLAVVVIQAYLVKQRELDWALANLERPVAITAGALQALGFGLVVAAAHSSFERVKAATTARRTSPSS